MSNENRAVAQGRDPWNRGVAARRIFRFLLRRQGRQYLILRGTHRAVSTNVNYQWPPTVPLHSNRPLNQRMIGVLIDCYSVIITVHCQTPRRPPYGDYEVSEHARRYSSALASITATNNELCVRNLADYLYISRMLTSTLPLFRHFSDIFSDSYIDVFFRSLNSVHGTFFCLQKYSRLF